MSGTIPSVSIPSQFDPHGGEPRRETSACEFNSAYERVRYVEGDMDCVRYEPRRPNEEAAPEPSLVFRVYAAMMPS